MGGSGQTISAAGVSDRGRIRLNNEDRFYVDAERGIYLVVDGVGGHAAGEVAATIACDVIVRRLDRLTGSAEERVREAIALANNEIVRQAASSPPFAGMTCVVTLALLEEDRLTIGHVGDSRLYLLTPHGIAKLTHDHSPVGEREDAQEISELDAMRHPRRNEVFRDVGSRLHEPDDPEFIEVIESRFDEASAMLLCSDGLSDMLPTPAIERTVRLRAGDPPGVVQALVDAANDAGGTDNVTAVYVEGPRFAVVQSRVVGDDRSLARSKAGSRAGWLSLGALLGIGIGLWSPYVVAFDTSLLPRRARTLVVGGSGSDHFPTIRAALDAARPKDVVQVEPGTYPEALVLPDGVDLVAAEPGTAVLVAPPAHAEGIGLSIQGRLGSRVSGLRVRGRPDAPMGTGITVAGHNVVIDDVTIEGTVSVGIDVEGNGAIVIRGSRFADITGIPLRIGAAARPVIRQSLFLQGTERRLAAIEIVGDAMPKLVENLVVGYGEAVSAPTDWTPTQLNELFQGNYRIPTPDAAR